MLIFISVTWLYHWWHSPAESVTITSADQVNQGVLGSESTLADWQTEYFTTRYPGNLRIISTNEVAHGITLGQYLLGAVSLNQSDQLAVTVGKLQTPLSQLSSVVLREQQSDVYARTDKTYAPAGAYVFTKENPYETSIFWQHGNEYAAVVSSGSPVRRAELEQALQSVVTNWQWR